jgi:predicted nucleic acid-binding protein
MVGSLTAKKVINLASFIDSNILTYAEALDESNKQNIALTLLRRLKLEEHGVLSTQWCENH